MCLCALEHKRQVVVVVVGDGMNSSCEVRENERRCKHGGELCSVTERLLNKEPSQRTKQRREEERIPYPDKP